MATRGDGLAWLHVCRSHGGRRSAVRDRPAHDGLTGLCRPLSRGRGPGRRRPPGRIQLPVGVEYGQGGWRRGSGADILVRMTTRIAWIGTGVMGASMCGHLLDAGHPVSLYTRTRSKAQPLIDRGAVWAATPRDAAAHADVVITMVGFPA